MKVYVLCLTSHQQLRSYGEGFTDCRGPGLTWDTRIQGNWFIHSAIAAPTAFYYRH